MNRFAYLIVGAVVGILFKDNIQAALHAVGLSAMKGAMELSENLQDLRAEAAEDRPSPAGPLQGA